VAHYLDFIKAISSKDSTICADIAPYRQRRDYANDSAQGAISSWLSGLVLSAAEVAEASGKLFPRNRLGRYSNTIAFPSFLNSCDRLSTPQLPP
jgi:hypothetical protein